MARRSRRGRDTPVITNPRLPLNDYVLSPYDRARQLNFDFRPIEDRREWHPEGPQRPARSLYRALHRLTLVQPEQPSPRRPQRRSTGLRNFPGGDYTRATVAFEDAPHVMVCVRRQMRREVLHAFGKTGRGQKKQRRPRRNWLSAVSCRRK